MYSKFNFGMVSLFVLSLILSGHSQDLQLNKLLEQSKIDRVGVFYRGNVDEPLRKDELQKIRDVFGNRTQNLVLENQTYLRDIKNLLRNRIKIIEINDISKQKKATLLSEVPINKTFNPNLARDLKFKPRHFNALKYQLEFFSRGTYLYHVDHTNYFIQISSQYRR